MLEDPGIDAIWICGPNHERIANMEAIVRALASGRGGLRGVACEKPLGRNLAEAKRMRELLSRTDLLDGYLENQVTIVETHRVGRSKPDLYILMSNARLHHVKEIAPNLRYCHDNSTC